MFGKEEFCTINSTQLPKKKSENEEDSVSLKADHNELLEILSLSSKPVVQEEQVVDFLPDNILRDWYQYCIKSTDAPGFLHIGAILPVLGALFADKCFLKLGHFTIRPNIWAILIAPSGICRKTTCLNISIKVLQAVCEIIEESRHFPSEFSPESLLSILQGQPCGVMTFSEYGSFLSNCKKSYMQGTIPLLTDLYDCPSIYTKQMKSGNLTIQNPALSILGASTIEWIESTLDTQDVMGGFYPRHLFVVSGNRERNYPIPEKTDKKPFSDLVAHLFDTFATLNETEYTMDAESTEFFKNWVTKVETQVNDLPVQDREMMASFVQRITINALKVAMLYTVILKENRNVIDFSFLKKSCLLMDYSIHSTMYFFKEACNDKELKARKKVLRIIASNYKDGVSRQKVLRATRFTSTRLDSLCETLEDMGIICSEKRMDVSTCRPSTYFFLTYEILEALKKRYNIDGIEE